VVEHRLQGLDESLGAVEERLGVMATQLHAVETGLASLKEDVAERFASVDSKLAEILGEVSKSEALPFWPTPDKPGISPTDAQEGAPEVTVIPYEWQPDFDGMTIGHPPEEDWGNVYWVFDGFTGNVIHSVPPGVTLATLPQGPMQLINFADAPAHLQDEIRASVKRINGRGVCIETSDGMRRRCEFQDR
jgi:hypothetical protein